MAKRLFSIPSPLQGDEQSLFVSFCIPDTPDWRRLIVGCLETITYGRAYDERTGDIKQAQAVGREIFASMSMCNLQEWIDAQKETAKAIRELTAVVGSLNLDLTQPVPDNANYANSGLAAKFYTNNWLTPDETITDVLANSLMGRYVDFPIPFEGEGLADILDDVLTILHNRLRMTDSSIWNPLAGEKNIVEALETLLRQDTITDLEFLTPNIVTTFKSIMTAGDSGVIALLKNTVSRIVSELDLPPNVADWLNDALDTNEYLTHAQILLLIAAAGGENGAAVIAGAIREAQTVINVNNVNGCCDQEDCDCDDGQEQTITVEDCEGEPVSSNGNGLAV